MFYAARKARHRHLQARPVRHGPSPWAGLAAWGREALDGAARNVAAAQEAAGELMEGSVAAALLRLQAAGLAAPRSLLLASVSSSALDQPQTAYLPSKSRPLKGGGPAAPAGAAAGGDAPADDEDDPSQRILIAEVGAQDRRAGVRLAAAGASWQPPSLSSPPRRPPQPAHTRPWQSALSLCARQRAMPMRRWTLWVWTAT